MKRSLLTLLIIAATACSTTDDDYAPPRRDMPRRDSSARIAAAGGLVELLPPEQWWHDPQISVGVNLSNDQMRSLDEISAKQQPEIERLRDDSRAIVRDLRSALEEERGDVIAAGQRIRKVRDELFDREVAYLAAQRAVLTREQWTALQNALQEQRQEQRFNRRDRSPGGFGGRGGRRGRLP